MKAQEHEKKSPRLEAQLFPRPKAAPPGDGGMGELPTAPLPVPAVASPTSSDAVVMNLDKACPVPGASTHSTFDGGSNV